MNYEVAFNLMVSLEFLALVFGFKGTLCQFFIWLVSFVAGVYTAHGKG